MKTCSIQKINEMKIKEKHDKQCNVDNDTTRKNNQK